MSPLVRWAACVSFLGAPASADDPWPLVLQSEIGELKDSAKAYDSLNDFARCMLKHGSTDVATFVAANYPPKHMDSGTEFLVGKYDYCLSRTSVLKLWPIYLRGALIEVIYHRFVSDGRDGRPITLGHVAPTDIPLSPMVAECLARLQHRNVLHPCGDLHRRGRRRIQHLRARGA